MKVVTLKPQFLRKVAATLMDLEAAIILTATLMTIAVSLAVKRATQLMGMKEKIAQLMSRMKVKIAMTLKMATALEKTTTMATTGTPISAQTPTLTATLEVATV